MTERKVLNKYFPPDYDPTKIPRIRRGDKRRQFNIRTMAPFNMRCTTCNGYIYKAKKFNSRMETAENVDYLGLRHYRFYIRCPTCCAEIIWRTDLESGDYVLESGAKRNFEALKTAEELEAKRQAEEEEELANNPMKMLEKRTDQSKQEMDMVEVIEDLKQLNQRQAGMEADQLLFRKLWEDKEAKMKAEQEEDEALIKELLASRDKPKESDGEHENDADLETTEATVVVEPQKKKPKLPSLFGAHKPEMSYMKRQFKGILIKKKPSSTKDVDPGPDSRVNTTNSQPPAKIPRFSDEHPVASGSNVTPKQPAANVLGISYSDDSDST
ncbi:unnamed protein product [Calicophoron daubneyi]|uniref:Splicing factor YJU2 n=1 Tax=Calicophoron daubneyi TaxID=300641 RepID=A0AAV2TY20_CALDB